MQILYARSGTVAAKSLGLPGQPEGLQLSQIKKGGSKNCVCLEANVYIDFVEVALTR